MSLYDFRLGVRFSRFAGHLGRIISICEGPVKIFFKKLISNGLGGMLLGLIALDM